MKQKKFFKVMKLGMKSKNIPKDKKKEKRKIINKYAISIPKFSIKNIKKTIIASSFMIQTLNISKISNNRFF